AARAPGLAPMLTCDHDLARDRSGEADIGLSFTMPADPELIVARLATLHFLAYASEAYLARRGVPRTIEDLRGHDYIEQVTPGANSTLRDYLIGIMGGDDAAVLRTNASLPLLFAVAHGDGVAVLPTYASLVTQRIVALPVPLRLRFEVYYWFHRHARDNPNVRAGIDWLKAAFDNRAYPCFADAFHDPREGALDAVADAPIAEVFRTLAG
ncbi:MAG: substrate-binding domain-containing protein, partial [Sphingomonadaceae bacterium]|nr:substrate-binding domain-containing protein [Sphingomonadaceae bacterium]